MPSFTSRRATRPLSTASTHGAGVAAPRTASLGTVERLWLRRDRQIDRDRHVGLEERAAARARASRTSTLPRCGSIDGAM